MVRLSHPPVPTQSQRGAGIIEFALVATVFFLMLMGAMDFGRALFTWNAAVEATRWGARVAVVCDKLTPAQIKTKMQRILPLSDAQIEINWYNPEGVVNNSCTPDTCKGVEVRIAGYTVPVLTPLGFLFPPVPPFATYLPRESMEATDAAGDQNPVCFM